MSSNSDATSGVHRVDDLYVRDVFQVPAGHGEKPVYEAWSFRQQILPGVGLKSSLLTSLRKKAAYHIDAVRITAVQGEQQDLAKMHMEEIDKFHKRNRRGWAARLLKGKPKSYEQDLDERCRMLPLYFQESISELLNDRGDASSTAYHTRTWTVAALQERDRYRFARPELAHSKRQRGRRWRGTLQEDDVLGDYLVIIRGCETSAPANGTKFKRFFEFANPWINVDVEELRERSRERSRLASVKREAGTRTPSSSPPSYRDWRARSVSPSPDRRAERRAERGRCRSPPSYRSRRRYSPSPESEVEVQARRYIQRSRVMARHAPPAAPEFLSCPPPRRYMRLTRSPSPYFDRPFVRPHVPYDEEEGWISGRQDDYQDDYPHPPPAEYAPQHFGMQPRDVEEDDEYFDDDPEYSETLPSVQDCPACQLTPNCGHFTRVCQRPVSWYGNVATHPPCFICMATAAPGTFSAYDAPPPPPLSPPPPPAEPIHVDFEIHSPRAMPPLPQYLSYDQYRGYVAAEIREHSGLEMAESEHANEATDIESDDGESVNEESTVVGEVPQPASQPAPQPKAEE